ncbi:MAG TPA: CHASE2 domain-containing protein [Allosphingosinicella sp.]|nr:CHASE2 domain-containing protein [Allosphingosinicella sp.]
MGKRRQSKWFVRGLATGTTGIFFSALCSGLFALLLALGVEWVELLERRGADLTMRSMVALYGPLSDDLAPDGRPATPIVFLDIDEEGCARLAPRPQRCFAQGIGEPAVQIAIGEALRESGAALIVLDVRWPEPEAFQGEFSRERMIRAWATGPGPPVVAAVPSSPTGGMSLAIDRDAIRDIPPGRLRFAASTVWPSEADGDMVIRAMPDAVSIVADARPDSPTRISAIPATALTVLGNDRALRDAADPTAARPILFTLPSLATEQGANLASEHIGDWERRILSRMLTAPPVGCAGCRPTIRTEGLAGQIVVVGSSAPVAGDLHMTPLGVMAGAEVIANAIRARQLAATLSEPSSGAVFWSKLWGTLPGMALSLITGLGLAWVAAWPRSRLWKRSLRKGTLTVLIFSAGLGGALVANLWFELRGALQPGHIEARVDILLPTLALFLEQFVAIAKWIIGQVEALFVRFFTRIAERYGRQ